MIGQKIIFKDTVDSTNNYAANLLALGELAQGTVILSGEQTAGKGQRGATWLAEPFKNLIFTCYVVYDNLSVNQRESITHFVSISLVQLLQDKGINAVIKWPNDILVGNSKIAGILIENQFENTQCKSSIIGIGLNVNQSDFANFNATSILNQTKKSFSVEEIAFSLIEHLNQNLMLLNQHRLDTLKEMYLKHLWLLHQKSLFEDESGIFEGIIQGTTSFGQLLVLKENEVKTYDLKEISFLERNTSESCESCN